MNKNQLRAAYRAKRQGLEWDEYIGLNNKIKSLFFQEFTPLAAKVVHSFLPVKERREVDTWPIIDKLRKAGTKVTIPKANIDTLQLTNYLLDDQTQLEDNMWGVPEPEQGEEVATSDIDLVLLPLLSFDQRGYRIGYGKGFYDRFLSQCRAGTLKIGLSFFPPEAEIEDVDKFDVRMDYCVTPDEVYRF